MLLASAALAKSAEAPAHPADFWQLVRERIVQCLLCPRRCVLNVGQLKACAAQKEKRALSGRLRAGGPLRRGHG